MVQSNPPLSSIMLITYHYSVFVHETYCYLKEMSATAYLCFSGKFGDMGFASELGGTVQATLFGKKQKSVKPMTSLCVFCLFVFFIHHIYAAYSISKPESYQHITHRVVT